MPRKKKIQQKQKQKQKQSQRVVVNVGTIAKSKKRSGRGGLPPPSHMHNLAPTFVTAPQVDYTPIIAMMQHHARPIVAQAPMPVTQTPLSASLQSAEQIAGEAAIRRAGPTAEGFQPLPSQADERYAREIQKVGDDEDERDFNLKMQMRRQPASEPFERGVAAGGGIIAEATVKKGRPFSEAQEAIPIETPTGFVPTATRQRSRGLGKAREIPSVPSKDIRQFFGKDI